MRQAVVVVVVAVGLLQGCLVGELSDIPCRQDTECPAEHFCDIPNETCIADAAGPADLVVSGVIDRTGAEVPAPRVESDAPSTLQLVILNQGGAPAEDIELEIVRLFCMNLEFDPLDVPPTLEAGAKANVEFTIEPHDCSAVSIQDWFLFYSGRAKRGTFNILPDNPPSTPGD
ncbi:MAG: hypothetical protein Q8O67_24770 [Deltaproteobacteria bacterium]|nr:hypothetical protein [Deltaproteobacteria bacterium]